MATNVGIVVGVAVGVMVASVVVVGVMDWGWCHGC